MQASTTPLVGPIQLVVIGFPPEAEFRGEILRAFADIRGRGVIRVIDALFVRKDDPGRITASMHESDLTRERELLGAMAGGLLGLMAGGDEESEALGPQLRRKLSPTMPSGWASATCRTSKTSPAGHAALVLLIEHQWALELKGAVRNAGGVPIIQGFLTPEALFMVGAELRAVTEAENTIALTQAVEGAAVLSALATVEAAEWSSKRQLPRPRAC